MTTSNRQTSRSPDEGSDATGAAEVSTSRRQFVRGVGVGLGGLAIGKSTGVSVAAESMPTPRLHVEGQWLKDPNGNDVVLRGLNTVDPWWGDEHAGMRGSTFDDTLDLITDPDRGWHPHVVRLPFEYAQGELGVQQTIDQYIRPLVDFLAERDTYAIIDYHRIERWDTDDVDRRLRAFWDAVAPEFADDEHVLFELFNEPTEPYGEGQAHWDQWKETAQPWLDLIRDHAPETPVIVGSPRWTTYTRYAAANPFEGENIVYANHTYPIHFENHDMDAVAAVADEVPVFITEWGYIQDQSKPEHMQGSTSDFGWPMRDFIEENPNVSWTAWCADSVWDPKMFDTDWNVLGGERYMGEFTKQYLHDRRSDDLPTDTAGSAGAPPAYNVDTTAPTDVAARSATLNAEVTGFGDAESIEDAHFQFWVEGAEESTKRWSDHTSLSEPGPYSFTVSELDSETTYVVKAITKNSAGEWDGGGTVEFTTPDAPPAYNVDTTAPTDVTPRSATLNAEVTGFGDAESIGDAHFQFWVEGAEESTKRWSDHTSLSEPGPYSFTVSELDSETTYVVKAITKNSAGEWDGGGTVEFTTPDGSPFVDDLQTWDKVHDRSDASNWKLDSTNASYFDGDQARASRDGQATTEHLVYKIDGASRFSARVYYFGNSADPSEVRFYASSDGRSYSVVSTSHTSPEATAGGWYRTEFTSSDDLPVGTDFLRVEFVGDGEYSWDKQLARFRAEY